jgi:MFS transporter, DHA3 family, macrolide efflux protein
MAHSNNVPIERHTAGRDMMPSHAPGWPLLKTRDFGLLFWGQLTSQIGDSLMRIALLWFVYQLTGSAMKMVMIGLLQTIPPLILGPIVGMYVDRTNKKSIMVGKVVNTDGSSG